MRFGCDITYSYETKSLNMHYAWRLWVSEVYEWKEAPLNKQTRVAGTQFYYHSQPLIHVMLICIRVALKKDLRQWAPRTISNSHIYKQSLTAFMAFNATLISHTKEPHLESFTSLHSIIPFMRSEALTFMVGRYISTPLLIMYGNTLTLSDMRVAK